MNDFIDRKAVLSVIMDLCATKEDYDEAYNKIMNISTVPDIDRAAIMRLCNEIEDIATDIRNHSESYYLICSYCRSIRERLKAIGKELTGDAGSD